MKDSKTNKQTEPYDAETATELGVEDFDSTETAYGRKHARIKYNEWLKTMPELIRALLIVSWICAAFAAFFSAYFAVVGTISAYAANRAAPGVGKAAMITNIVLGVLNVLLSIAFITAIKNLYAFI